ncbi:MAG: protein-L-isoaspartate(D-aspartate) O-methyltransferase [Verrucomicrobiales bacterium]|jgi:protein-L-isoaspartate(D-aspartate) O-methyltransferase|nr:protein-L-isoaspartate(D-aspartate) O-methyltransferase [Verrucomicrobiales bacterium]
MTRDQFSGPDRIDITSEEVLKAMKLVPRHSFVPESQRSKAYEDRPLPIGHGQTISQPYIVALMTEKLDPNEDDRVLEIGTGSGYQAAVLANLVKDVYTIEIVEPLGKRAAETLEKLNYENVHVCIGDGYKGWPEQAPFDAIIVTCAPEHVPQPLVDQLKEGGRMMIPVGKHLQMQDLYLLEKSDGKLTRKSVLQVRFVPMTGQARKSQDHSE